MQPPKAFCVKELAPLLGVSVRYVYEMRRHGFTMRGPVRTNRTASLAEAVGWIRARGFRMVNGVWRMQ